MRVGMMLRDTEYRDAMIEMMSALGKDILLEVAGPSGLSRDAVIITDIMPSEIDEQSLSKIKNRTLFLSPVPVKSNSDSRKYTGSVLNEAGTGSPSGGSDEEAAYDGCHILFKYSSLSSVMAELSMVYSQWTGDTGSIDPSTRFIAVLGETDQNASGRCRALAGQILYRHGGTLLIIPLSYINDYVPSEGSDDRGWFRRLMYLIDDGRDFPHESFTWTDSYGISGLRLPGGINPLTELDIAHLGSLIRSLGRHFDTVILDIGTCYSRTNLKILGSADNIVYFGSGRRIGELADFIGKENASAARKIGISDAGAEALGLDDFVREIYVRTEEKSSDT